MVELLGIGFWLIPTGLVLRWLLRTTAFDTGLVPQHVQTEPAPRTYVVEVEGVGDHEFAELPLTELIGHMYEQHWEVWNIIGPRDPRPEIWRQEHAADHGLVLYA